MHSLRLSALLCFVPLVLTGSCSEDPRAEAVTKEMKEAGDAVLDYASMKRDELKDAMTERLERLDQRIEELRTKATESSREGWNETLEQLEQRRSAVQEELKALGAAGDDAWQEVRGGLVKAYEDLAQAVDQAADDWQDQRP